MSEESVCVGDLLALYDRALPQVYGYLRARCDTQSAAEDLTAETFLAAVDATRGAGCPTIDVAWLIGVARHKLVDHWRRKERELRGLRLVAFEPDPVEDDPWDAQLDALRAPTRCWARSARTTAPRSPFATWTTCPSPRWPT